MKLTVAEDVLSLPTGHLEVISPTSDGPKVESLEIPDSDAVEAATIIVSHYGASVSYLDFSSKSEVVAFAVNRLDFRRKYHEAFAI